MEEMPSSTPWPIFYECPSCRQEVEAIAGDTAQLIHCPQCGEAFVVAADDGSTDIPEPRQDDSDHAKRREEELNGLRIRQLSTMRRTAIRSQSYCLVVIGAGVVGSIQLIINAVKHIHAHTKILTAMGEVIFTIVLLRLAWYFTGLAREYHRQSRQTSLPEPETPPDFSDLGDGSQTVRNLEELQ